MRSRAAFLAGLCVLCLVSAIAFGTAGSGDRVLLDGPRGAWLAAVRSDAPLSVIEERDGWLHVRLEGWMPATGGPEKAPDAPAPQRPDPPAGGARVRGVLLGTGTGGAAGAGSGLIVLLLGDLETLDREHAEAGGGCRQSLHDVEARIDALQDELTRALNSSDNMRQAAERNDRVKSSLAKAVKERGERLRDCRTAADGIMARHALQKGITDDRGAFEFTGVAPGRYRVFASESAGEAPRAWLLECDVTASADSIVLDPRRDRSSIDPYWGLH